MNQLFPQFLHFLEQRSGLQPGKAVLITVSGGVDSMVLLQLFHRAQAHFPLRLHAVHINYGLRGVESQADMDLVKSECEKLQVPCSCLNWAGAENQENLHDALRQFRYAQFWQLAGERALDVVATAHHMDDQAESILMHLFRGSGLKGASGMREREERSEGVLLRPLLQCEKSEISAYAKSENINYREDSSNQQNAYWRNWLRQEIFPLLQERYSAVSKSLHRFAEHAFQDDAALQYYTTLGYEQSMIEQAEDHLSFALPKLRELPQAIRSRIYMKAFQQLAKASLYEDHVQRIEDFVIDLSEARKTYSLPKGVSAVKIGKALAFVREITV